MIRRNTVSILLTIALCQGALAFRAAADDTPALTVHLDGVTGDGPVYIGLYDSAETFLDDSASAYQLRVAAGVTEVALPDFAAGLYAFAAYEDRNGNAELDTGLFGAPSEPYAFSKNARPMFGVPKFSACALMLAPGDSVTLKLR